MTHIISLGVDFFTIVKKVEVEIEWIYISTICCLRWFSLFNVSLEK